MRQWQRRWRAGSSRGVAVSEQAENGEGQEGRRQRASTAPQATKLELTLADAVPPILTAIMMEDVFIAEDWNSCSSNIWMLPGEARFDSCQSCRPLPVWQYLRGWPAPTRMSRGERQGSGRSRKVGTACPREGARERGQGGGSGEEKTYSSTR